VSSYTKTIFQKVYTPEEAFISSTWHIPTLLFPGPVVFWAPLPFTPPHGLAKIKVGRKRRGLQPAIWRIQSDPSLVIRSLVDGSRGWRLLWLKDNSKHRPGSLTSSVKFISCAKSTCLLKYRESSLFWLTISPSPIGLRIQSLRLLPPFVASYCSSINMCWSNRSCSRSNSRSRRRSRPIRT